jgi:hypothetical protein
MPFPVQNAAVRPNLRLNMTEPELADRIETEANHVLLTLWRCRFRLGGAGVSDQQINPVLLRVLDKAREKAQESFKEDSGIPVE